MQGQFAAPIVAHSIARGARRVLLDKVATCAALILLGSEYGEPGKRGASPTEEESTEARDRGIDVLALVQDIDDREPAQNEFIARVRGGWEAGGLTGRFADDRDFGMKVVRALNDWRRSRRGADAASAAQDAPAALNAGVRQQRLKAPGGRSPGPVPPGTRRVTSATRRCPTTSPAPPARAASSLRRWASR